MNNCNKNRAVTNTRIKLIIRYNSTQGRIWSFDDITTEPSGLAISENFDTYKERFPGVPLRLVWILDMFLSTEK